MIRRLLTSAAALALLAGAAQSRELIFGSWLSATNATNTVAMEPYFAALKEATGGEIDWKMVPGAQLANGPGTPDAVKSNLIDGGITMAPYVPKMLPSMNMIFSQSLIGDDMLAATAAMNDVLMLGCPQCREEFEHANAVGFGGYSVSPYLLMCRGTPQGLADVKGLKVRASGGGVGIMTLAGATPVAMPPNEATTAIERGALDCVLGSVQWLRSFGYMDVVDTVLDAPLGMGGPPVLMYVNRDVWEEFTPEQRRLHIDLMVDVVVRETFDAQMAEDADVIAAAKEKGITFVDAAADFAPVMAERDTQQYAENVANAKAARVENPEAVLDYYLASYAKWQKIIAEEVGQDREKFRAALKREIFDKVDPEAL
ncbi:C4-dicarboxylate TRAP transporter substrate-binding protein [Paroceanicella profunda]|nr:C4-dicarboxylate TRAP transporter substrate-binding protein [Paroceanicella profunda]